MAKKQPKVEWKDPWKNDAEKRAAWKRTQQELAREELKIDKGVPIPRRGAGRGLSKEAELMKLMKVGDSLWMRKPNRLASQLASRWLGKSKYSVRKEGEGVRVWRIK